MKRTPLIVGNWKMNGLPSFWQELAAGVAGITKQTNAELVICPPFPALSVVHAAIHAGAEKSSVGLGAQNVHQAEKGAYTGEVSAPMVRGCGCDYVILGHSERRAMMAETDEIVAAKAVAAIENDLKPIVCIGETTRSDMDQALATLEKQLRQSLQGVHIKTGDDLVVAYEPVWAIGTGVVPTAADLAVAFPFLRKTLANIYNEEVAAGVRLLYGGSLTPDNADEILAVDDIDGGLIGGASLKVDSFLAIANAAD